MFYFKLLKSTRTKFISIKYLDLIRSRPEPTRKKFQLALRLSTKARTINFANSVPQYNRMPVRKRSHKFSYLLVKLFLYVIKSCNDPCRRSKKKGYLHHISYFFFNKNVHNSLRIITLLHVNVFNLLMVLKR